MNHLAKLVNVATWNKAVCTQFDTNLIVRTYAARKGTREKARKKKVKVEVKKFEFIPHKLRKAQLETNRFSKRFNDMWKQIPVDDVWVAKYNRLKEYNFEEAVNCHRETHHPTMYNEPNAFLNAVIELDMRAEKKNRFVDNINRIVAIPHPFEQNLERTVLALAKGHEFQAEATKAGATLAGGPEIIKDVQNGDILLQDYHFIVAHPNILPELVVLRGIMKKKFPNPKFGTLGVELYDMVRRFLTGIQYTAEKDVHEQDFAAVETAIGTLNMNTEHLEENLKALINDLNSIRPKREGPFVTRCFLTSIPSKEKLKINLDKYLGISTNYSAEEDVEEQDENEKISVKN